MEIFPQYLHRPYQVLWFETDDLGIIIVTFTLSLLFGGVFWGFLLVVPFIYMRFKSKAPRGFFKHLLYYVGLVSFKHYPLFMAKEFYE